MKCHIPETFEISAARKRGSCKAQPALSRRPAVRGVLQSLTGDLPIIATRIIALMTVGLTLFMPIVAGAEATSRLGVGATYWTSLRSVKVDNVDRDGFSLLATYQYRPGLLGVQLDMEWLPDRFGEKAYAPAAYLVFGRGVYAAAGVGMVHQDGDWADNPFFALRAGVDLEFLQFLFVDLGVSYRFDSKTRLDDAVDKIDTDTLYLGAAVRMAF